MAIMDLFRPKWRHSNWQVAWDAVQTFTDQGLLAKIAKSNCDIKVRWQSIEKLTDQALLAEIAKLKIDASVRERAVKKAQREKSSSPGRDRQDGQRRQGAFDRCKETQRPGSAS